MQASRARAEANRSPFLRRLRDAWTGQTDARPLALFRVALGLVLFEEWAARLPDLLPFLGPDALRPASRAAWSWTVFDLATTPARTLVLYALGSLPILAFTLGYRTRLATLLAFAFECSVENRNLLVCDSGDTLVRMMLFWGIFADLGGRFSLDVRLGRRPAARTTRARFVRFLHLQVALMYVASVVAKTGQSWADGSAVGRALADPNLARPLGAWLVGVPLVCRAFTHLTLAVEGGFPVLILAPWAQPWATRLGLLSGVVLHAGIFLTMRVGIFSVVVTAAYLTFLDRALLDEAARRLPWLAAPGSASGSPSATCAVPWGLGASWRTRLERGLGALLAAQLAVIGWSLLPAAPSWIRRETQLTCTWQNWSMFSPDAPFVSYRLFARGEDAAGHEVDPLAATAPELLVQRRTWYRRWDKLHANLGAAQKRALGALGRYACRTYDRDASRAPLSDFRLFVDVEPVDAPGVPDTVEARPDALYWTQKCGGRGYSPD